MDHSGLLIAVESTDESSGSAQFVRLRDGLIADGYRVASFEFPRLDQPSSYFVKQLQSGDFGKPSDVGPYTGALFFALDRYQASGSIKQALADGKVVIVNRYTGSNMAYQGVQLTHPEERRGFFIWLDNLEFQMLAIPRPEKNIVLRTNTDEEGASIVQVYDDMCQLFPKDFTRLDCNRGGVALNDDSVHKLLRETIDPLLPAKKVVVAKTLTPTPSFFTPESLDSATKAIYQKTIEKILGIHQQLSEQLISHSKFQGHAAIQEILPVSTIKHVDAESIVDYVTDSDNNPSKNEISEIARKNLPDALAPPADNLSLANYSPRNELDLATDILYDHSNLSLAEIRSRLEAIPYEQKLKTLQSYLNLPSQMKSVLQGVHYTWDLMTSFSTFYEFRKIMPKSNMTYQGLTPRNGYAVPQIIDELNLAELYQEAFDCSLELFSRMQAAGYHLEAQYATLLGHKMRWKVTYNAREAFHLHELRTSPQGHPGYRKLVQQMHDKLAEVHPILAESMKFVNQGEDEALTRLAAERYTQFKLSQL